MLAVTSTVTTIINRIELVSKTYVLCKVINQSLCSANETQKKKSRGVRDFFVNGLFYFFRSHHSAYFAGVCKTAVFVVDG